MNLSDKIMMLRKKNGWSQEELADKLDVTRQSVSKWEGAQSVPDIGKIVLMSEIFGVTTDFLLKDDMESEEFAPVEEKPSGRHISVQEADDFLTARRKAALWIAAGVFLCMLSPMCLLLMTGALEQGMVRLTEEAACGVGLGVLLILVAVACVIFVVCGNRAREYAYLDEELFSLQHSAGEMVAQKKKAFSRIYGCCIAFGVCLCVLAAMPVILGGLFTENAFYLMGSLCFTILLAALGVVLFVWSGVIWASLQKLLQEGEYTPEKKADQKKDDKIGAIYWPVVTAVYLAYSFITNQWHISWVIWPVAGVLFAAIAAVYKGVSAHKE